MVNLNVSHDRMVHINFGAFFVDVVSNYIPDSARRVARCIPPSRDGAD